MKKKFIAIVLGTAVSLHSLSLSSLCVKADDVVVTADTAVMGDLNGDGFFNIADVVMMQGYLAGKKTLDAETLKNADINGDGKVNVFDLIAMKRKVVERINESQENGGEPVSLGLWDYDSYMKYIDENDLADKIVTYDKIAHIGKFRQCVILSNSARGDHSQIMYSLDDGSGHPLHLIVTELDKVKDDGLPEMQESEIDLSDMRTTLSADTKGKYVYNGTAYNYAGGKLLSVSWKDDDHEYKLTGSSMLYDYPINVNTFTSEKISPMNSGIGSPDGDEPVSVGFWNYDDYSRYIAENGLAGKIVTYDKIAYMGKFRQCIILSDSHLGDYSKIMYSLDDGSGHPLHLIVTELDKVNDDRLPDINDIEIKLLDLRTTVSADTKGKYLYNGKTYHYSGGRLLAVSWNDGSYEYRLTGSSMLYDYPIDADTYTSALLRMWEFAPIPYSNEFEGTLKNDYIITSTKELVDYFFSIYGAIIECDVICPENETVNQFLHKYNDEFFKNNVLLMKPFLQSSAGGDEPYYSIDGIEYFGDTLYVSYSENPYSGASCDVIIPQLAQIVLPKAKYRANKVVWQRSDTSPSFDADEINFICIQSFPGSAGHIREYSSPEKIGKVAAYLNGLHLKKNFPENPDEYNGVTWEIRIGFKNGDKKPVYLFGNMFYREEGGDWLRMNYNEAVVFEDLIYDNPSD